MVLLPLELNAGLNAVLLDSGFEAQMNLDRIGVFGYSLGSFTAQAAAGGRASFSQVVKYCATFRNDLAFCLGIRPQMRCLFTEPLAFIWIRISMTPDLKLWYWRRPWAPHSRILIGLNCRYFWCGQVPKRHYARRIRPKKFIVYSRNCIAMK